MEKNPKVNVKVLRRWSPVIPIPIDHPNRAPQESLQFEKLGNGKKKRYVTTSTRKISTKRKPLTKSVADKTRALIEKVKGNAKTRGFPFFDAPKARVTQESQFGGVVFTPTTNTTYFKWTGPRNTPEYKGDKAKIDTYDLMKMYPHILSTGVIIEVGPKGRKPTHILLAERSQNVNVYPGYGHMASGFLDLEKVNDQEVPEIPSQSVIREVAEELFIKPSNHNVKLSGKLKNAKTFPLHFLDKDLNPVPVEHPLSKYSEKSIRMEPPAVAYGIDVDNANPFVMYAIRVHATKTEIEKAMKNAPDKWEMKSPVFVKYNSKALLKELNTRTYIWDTAIRVFAKALKAKEKKK